MEDKNLWWYKRTYEQLIERGKLRGLDKNKLDGYYEKHHIIPRCVGGLDEDSNYVLLTRKEHILAHKLLFRIYDNNPKLIFAYVEMSSIEILDNGKRVRKQLSIKQIEENKKLFSNSRQGVNNPMFGRKQTDETKKKISEKNKGRKLTKEQSKKHSERLKGRVLTESWKQKISNSMTGKPHPHKSQNYTKEGLEKMRNLLRQRTGDKHPNSKKVINTITGEIWNSITECANANNMTRPQLSYQLNKGKSSIYKFYTT